MDRPLKVALLGAGGRGRAVLNNWIKLTGCQITAIIDPSRDSIEHTLSYLQKYSPEADLTATQLVTDVSGWYARADCDVVTINSWDPQHAENAVACFEAGLNVQIAKPLAQNMVDCDRVVRAWKASGKIGVTDLQLRTSNLAQRAREIINRGSLGAVRFINCFDYVGRSGAEFRHHRSRRKDMIRSWTLAKGVHALDLCNFLMDDAPVRAYASGGLDVYGGQMPDELHCPECEIQEECQFEGAKSTIGGHSYPVPNSLCVFAEEIDITDNLAAVVEYSRGGRLSYSEVYFTPEYQILLDIIGDRGALRLRYAMDDNNWIEWRDRRSATVEHIDIEPSTGAHGGGDHNIIRQMAEALRLDRQMRPDILDGRNAVALAEAIDISIESQEPVTIAPAPVIRSFDQRFGQRVDFEATPGLLTSPEFGLADS